MYRQLFLATRWISSTRWWNVLKSFDRQLQWIKVLFLHIVPVHFQNVTITKWKCQKNEECMKCHRWILQIGVNRNFEQNGISFLSDTVNSIFFLYVLLCRYLQPWLKQ